VSTKRAHPHVQDSLDVKRQDSRPCAPFQGAYAPPNRVIRRIKGPRHARLIQELAACPRRMGSLSRASDH
jgi:hypothetical protein